MSENLDPNQGADIPSPDRFKINGDFLVRKGNGFCTRPVCRITGVIDAIFQQLAFPSLRTPLY